MSNNTKKAQKAQGLQSQSKIIRELEYWARDKDDRYPAQNGLKSYSYALSQFKDYFFRLQKGQAKQVSLCYWVKAWGWDFRKIVRFIAYCLKALERFWALGNEILQKFLKVAKKVAYSAKKAVYKMRGKELPDEPEPTQSELEELWAQTVANATGKEPKKYKNFLLAQLEKGDKMTVANFNEWVKGQAKGQEEQKRQKELENRIANFSWHSIIGKPVNDRGTTISNILYITANYIDVKLSDGTRREIEKAHILRAAGLVA